MMIEIRVFGYPVAQGRPRVARVGGFIKVYDPEKSRDWKRTVKAQVIPLKPPMLLDGPLRLSLRFFLPRPGSLPKRVVQHTKKPDVKNLTSAVEDALSGIIFVDDRQVVDLHTTKEYSAEPGVLIHVEEL